VCVCACSCRLDAQPSHTGGTVCAASQFDKHAAGRCQHPWACTHHIFLILSALIGSHPSSSTVHTGCVATPGAAAHARADIWPGTSAGCKQRARAPRPLGGACPTFLVKMCFKSEVCALSAMWGPPAKVGKCAQFACVHAHSACPQCGRPRPA